LRSEARGRHLLVNVLALGFALALVASPSLVPPCGHGSAMAPMRCHWTFQVELLLAGTAVLTAISLWIVRQQQARTVVGFALVGLGGLVVAVSQQWVVGLCGNSAMACHQTAHWLWLWAGLLAVVGVGVGLRGRGPAGRSDARDPWEEQQESAGAA